MTKSQCQMNPDNVKSNKKYDIHERALEFSIRAARFVNDLPNNQTALIYGKQLIRSSSSVGANLEEADGTLSKKDFINKMAISRREARESRYWLTLIDRVVLPASALFKHESLFLAGEARELMLILSAIINKTKAGS